MKRTLYLFSAAMILTLMVSMVQATSAPAQMAWTPTPSEWGDPGPTPTPFTDWTLTPTEITDPDAPPTPVVDWPPTPFPEWTLTPGGLRIIYVNQNATGVNTGTSWTDAFTDLQNALLAASSGDEIWVAMGTYKPTTTTDASASFQLRDGVAIYGGFTGDEASRDQRDLGSYQTVLSGDLGMGWDNSDNSERVVVADGVGSTAILDGFTIADGNAGFGVGAGIFNINSNPTFANLFITRNKAQYGAGMYNSDSSPTLTNIVFDWNQATHAGGGMYNSNSNPTLVNVAFRNNVVENNGNETQGAGIYNVYSSPVLENVTFSSNRATQGAGIYNHVSSPEIRNATFNNNYASLGGAIYNTQSENVVLTNVTFFQNSAYYGGALYNDLGWVNLNHVTLHRNSANEQGGGIYSNGNLTVNNTILWGNTAKEGPQVYMAIGGPSFHDSIIQGGCPIGTVCEHVEDADPRLGVFADNGGFGWTLPLIPGSSAIDTGEDASCPATDQRGTPRPQGVGCDIGAYETTSSYIPVTRTVTKVADTNDGVCDSDCSLREAMIAAQNGDKITFGISGMIVLDSTLPLIEKTLTIDGSGQSVAVDGASSYRIFEVIEGGHLIINQLTLQNGHGSPCFDNETNTCGGAIYTDLGNLTITNSTFSGNSARVGGAIFMGNGIADITASTFFGNTATYGGGGILNWIGSVSVTNSTFVNNSAPYGGGIYNDVAFLTLINTTFSENSGELGSSLYNEAGSARLFNNILANSLSGSDCYNNDEYAEIAVTAYNLIEVNVASPNNCGTPAFTDDPNLGPLADNDGMTQTMALLSGSPVIDAGDDTICPTADQRGVLRPQGSGCDMGAYEVGELDTTPPVIVSIVRADPNPTRAAYVDFTVTFSEEVTGVDARDFALRTLGGIRGAAIAEVSGSGSVYTVTVKTGRGSGFLRLDVPLRATVTDLAGNPLGSLPFKKGEVYKVIGHWR